MIIYYVSQPAELRDGRQPFLSFLHTHTHTLFLAVSSSSLPLTLSLWPWASVASGCCCEFNAGVWRTDGEGLGQGSHNSYPSIHPFMLLMNERKKFFSPYFDRWLLEFAGSDEEFISYALFLDSSFSFQIGHEQYLNTFNFSFSTFWGEKKIMICILVILHFKNINCCRWTGQSFFMVEAKYGGEWRSWLCDSAYGLCVSGCISLQSQPFSQHSCWLPFWGTADICLLSPSDTLLGRGLWHFWPCVFMSVCVCVCGGWWVIWVCPPDILLDANSIHRHGSWRGGGHPCV